MRRSLAIALSCTVLSAVPVQSQDPWSKVPPFPTTCYQNDNNAFGERIKTIRNELFTAADQMEVGNTELRQRLTDMDMSEKQSKMMAYMMKNPTEAGKVMQDIAMSGEKSAKDLERLQQSTKAFDEQVKAAEAQWEKEKAPLNAIFAEYSRVVPQPGAPGNPALARKYAADYDVEYQRLCGKMLLAESSPLLKHLADLKQYLTGEALTMDRDREKYEKLQFEVYGVPTTGLKSTGAHKSVIRYLDAMHKVFDRRPVATLTSSVPK